MSLISLPLLGLEGLLSAFLVDAQTLSVQSAEKDAMIGSLGWNVTP